MSDKSCYQNLFVKFLSLQTQQSHLQQVLHPCQNLGDVERFAQKIQSTDLQCPQFFIGLGGDDQNRQDAVTLYAFEALHYLKTVHLWHIQVQKDQVVSVLSMQIQHLGRILCGGDGGIARAAQQALKQEHVGDLIVDDEQFGLQDGGGGDHVLFRVLGISRDLGEPAFL
jgi:hypothetical protein